MTEIMPSISSLKPLDHLSAQSLLPKEGNAEAAQQFEGLMMSQLFQTLRKTVEPSGLFKEGENSRETYEYLLDKALVEQAMACGKGWGLAEQIQRSWSESAGKK